MSTTVQCGTPIERGYPWRVRIALTGTGMFPAGVALKASVREWREAPVSLADLTSGGGNLTRVDNDPIDITMTNVQTALLPAGHVIMDIARTDPSPDEHLDITVSVPVKQPITVAS